MQPNIDWSGLDGDGNELCNDTYIRYAHIQSAEDVLDVCTMYVVPFLKWKWWLFEFMQAISFFIFILFLSNK